MLASGFAQGNFLEINMGETFSYLQAGLDITIKTFISTDIDCLIFQTSVFYTPV